MVRINTHGPEPATFDADKAIMSNKNDKRRSVKLERSKLGASWGFTLQVRLSFSVIIDLVPAKNLSFILESKLRL